MRGNGAFGRFRILWRHGQALVFLLFIVVGGAWVADGVWQGVQGGEGAAAARAMAVLGVVLFVVGALGLYGLRRGLVATIATERSTVPPEVKVLILGLSNDDEGFVRTAAVLARENGLTLADVARPVQAFRAALAAMPPSAKREALERFGRSRWQQPLRALFAAGAQIEHAILLTSRESQEQVNAFRDLLAALPPPDGRAHPAILVAARLPGGHERNFDSYNDVIEAAEHALAFATRSPADGGLGRRPNELCLDVTAGTKTFSIAVGVVTLNQALHFSYVGNDGIAKFYDANLSSPNLAMGRRGVPGVIVESVRNRTLGGNPLERIAHSAERA